MAKFHGSSMQTSVQQQHIENSFQLQPALQDFAAFILTAVWALVIIYYSKKSTEMLRMRMCSIVHYFVVHYYEYVCY